LVGQRVRVRQANTSVSSIARVGGILKMLSARVLSFAWALMPNVQNRQTSKTLMETHEAHVL
jgi:hypothetical protein